MAAETLEEELQVLDHKLAQLKREYEQYFLGTRPRAPGVLRSEVNKIVAILTNTPLQNTALRFKFSSLCSRYQAFKRQWDETLRKIEAGTYERHRFKAKIQHSGEGGQAQRLSVPSGKGPAADDLYQSYVDARLACGESVKGLTRDKLERVVAKQTAQLRSKFGDESKFAFRVSVEDGKVRLKAARSKGG